MTVRAVLASVVAAGAAAAVLPAQTPQFRGGVEAVRIDVSVTRGPTPVPGLTADNFEIADNGKAEVIREVSQEDVPLKLMLVLDTSGSMAGARLAGLIDAAGALVHSLHPADQVGLLSFSQRIILSVPPGTSHDRVLSALGELGATGPTALRDALFAGLQLVQPDGQSRPVVVLFSDGHDTASWMAADDIEGVVRRSGVILHALELVMRPGQTEAQDVRGARLRSNGSSSRVGASRSLLRAVEAGGGRVWSTADAGQLKGLFISALDELRARYVLTYVPAGPQTTGWHDVKVTLKGARGDVRARPGYFVPAAP